MARYEVRPAAGGWQRDAIVLGCDYNPEQWPESVWLEDVALMREAGVGLVAINIFGWAQLEPRPGQFEFEALDRIMDLLHEHGIRVNLGTGTASPPPWLSARHPEILPMTVDGTTRWPGGRQAWCPSSPVFRRAALELLAAVAERYATHPALAMWHVSNELGCHNALCYCDVSAGSFRLWLTARYGTIEALNDAWGTAVWSQRYGSWDEILPPRATLSAGNPAQRLDFARFSSDELLEYYRAEAGLLRAAGGTPVTTNFMITAHIRTQDYWRWAADVDIVANDHYLDHRLPHPTRELSFAADLTRGVASGQPWLLMEQSTSAVSWQPHNLAKAPGELLRNSLTHVARGADGVCFFQWRAARQGAEKFHSAMLPHAGTDSAIWRETLELSAALRSLAEVAGSRVEASVALVFSWESWWAAESDSNPSSSVTYLGQVHAAYEALLANGVTVDIVEPGAALDDYALVVVPCLYLVTDPDAATIADYVEGGGSALVTFFSGLADEDDRLRVGAGTWATMLGASTEQFFPLLPSAAVQLGDGSIGAVWSELVRPTSATTVASFVDGPVAGSPAITRNSHGAGKAWYVATALDAGSFGSLVSQVLAGLDVPTRGGTAVEVVTRVSEHARFTFVINHSDESFELPMTGVELITGQTVASTLVIPAGHVRVVRERNEQ
jgi:beta-galactosidase